MADNISILGCGWLGLPLAIALREDGYLVNGSTTSEDKVKLLKSHGIEPFLLNLNPTFNGNGISQFLAAETLIICIPPSSRRPDVESFVPQQFQHLIAAIESSPVRWVIFTSSTSVYPANNQTAVEDDETPPTKASGRALRQAEGLLCGSAHFDCTILRLAGLIGPGRFPGNFLARKRDVRNGQSPVNLIHRDDCIGIIRQLLTQEVRNTIFNAVAPAHPLRADYYTAAAKALGLAPPTFNSDTASVGKIVSGTRLKERLQYEFLYPDPAQCFCG